MKRGTFLVIAAMTALWGSGLAIAQDEAPGEIKVTMVQHPDGSHTDTQKDLSAGTAESKTFDASGKLTQRITYKLDENGREIEGTAFSQKGSPLYRFGLVRNSAGQIAEERDVSMAGQPLRKLVYHYDSNGHVSKIDTYDGQGNLIVPPSKKRSHGS